MPTCREHLITQRKGKQSLVFCFWLHPTWPTLSTDSCSTDNVHDLTNNGRDCRLRFICNLASERPVLHLLVDVLSLELYMALYYNLVQVHVYSVLFAITAAAVQGAAV